DACSAAGADVVSVATDGAVDCAVKSGACSIAAGSALVMAAGTELETSSPASELAVLPSNVIAVKIKV
ncbi:hypothetical protein, partial [uncultured Streptococcus sp.]|uniref:hypothetical protein n=1 Tax=uncultured Streptococcus sp. TaxID=83427 RepID=UPI0025FE4C15